MQRQKELPTQKTQVDQQTKEKTRDKKNIEKRKNKYREVL